MGLQDTEGSNLGDIYYPNSLCWLHQLSLDLHGSYLPSKRILGVMVNHCYMVDGHEGIPLGKHLEISVRTNFVPECWMDTEVEILKRVC